MRFVIYAASLLCWAHGFASADRPTGSAEEAARLIQQGNPRGAAVTVQHALAAAPRDILLRQEAASLLLLTGDVEGASGVWKSVLEEFPGDALSVYGLAIAALQKGDRSKALDLIEVAAKNGDRATCLIADRYLDILTGAAGAGLGLTLPDAYAASAKGISGMAAARSGD